MYNVYYCYAVHCRDEYDLCFIWFFILSIIKSRRVLMVWFFGCIWKESCHGNNFVFILFIHTFGLKLAVSCFFLSFFGWKRCSRVFVAASLGLRLTAVVQLSKRSNKSGKFCLSVNLNCFRNTESDVWSWSCKFSFVFCLLFACNVYVQGQNFDCLIWNFNDTLSVHTNELTCINTVKFNYIIIFDWNIRMRICT